MTRQDPLTYGKVIRDPVHDYIRVPNEILPLVRSVYLQRLRNISQNSRASAIYPSLNGSRFEHALGTMHLAARAWRTAWANVWGLQDGPPEIARQQFIREVYTDLEAYRAGGTALADPCMERYFSSKRGFDDFSSDFERLVEWTVSVLGLIHDLGHPPFSHVLESSFERYADKLLAKGAGATGARYKQYVADVEHGVAQFHEFAGGAIFDQLVQEDRLFAELPRMMIVLTFKARKGNDWKSALHQLIDGQVDVDRLDYIMRDALRAGTDYHAIDSERLIESLELHQRPNTESGHEWIIGLGIRGVSAMESLLLQRLQSYRWMIFHAQALLTDTCLKRVFDFAVSGSIPSVATPDLDYISHWVGRPGDIAPSYKVDDHRVFEWLRAVRSAAAALESPDDEQERALAHFRVADEMSTEYRAAWRTYGEFMDALEASPARDRLMEPNSDGVPSRITQVLSTLVKERVNSTELLQLDEAIEARLNAAASVVDNVRGCWIVCERHKFVALKPARDPLWQGQTEIQFDRLSPIAASLSESEDMRPIIWAFFLPLDPDASLPSEVVIANLALDHIVAELTTQDSENEEMS